MARRSTTQRLIVELVLGPSPDPPPVATRVDVVFSEPGGPTRRVPAFWSGGQWRVRYSSGVVGLHEYGDGDDALADPTGVVDIGPGEAGLPLHVHGPLRVADDHRHLEHADGAPSAQTPVALSRPGCLRRPARQGRTSR